MSNIIDPTKPPQRKQIAALTAEEFEKIGGALQRINEIRDAAIKKPTDDAELAELIAFAGKGLIDHAPELLGCWITVRQEYQPLLHVAAGFLRRVDAINAQAYQRTAAQAQCCPGGCKCEQPAAAPDNVVPLTPAQ